MSNTAPTDAQIIALYNWVFSDGIKPRRNWKSLLNAAWMRSGQGTEGYTPELQQLRNQFGPDWLYKQSAQGIERMALRARTIRAASMAAERQS